MRKAKGWMVMLIAWGFIWNLLACGMASVDRVHGAEVLADMAYLSFVAAVGVGLVSLFRSYWRFHRDRRFSLAEASMASPGSDAGPL